MKAVKRDRSTRRLTRSFLLVAACFAVLFLAFEIVGKLSQKEEEPPPEEPAVEAPPAREPAANPYDLSLFREEGGFIVYDGEPKARKGIDVSAHQGKIDWAAVAAAGVEFAMIRVGYRGYTEGSTSLDELFYENVAGARENGIDVGVYFFSQSLDREEAEEEAEIVLRAIEGLDITYPIIYDWEEIIGEARTDGMDPKVLTGCARAFCRRIEREGYRAGVYFNQAFGYQYYNLVALEEYVLWLAQYAPVPDFRYGFQIWQYSSTGRVDGINCDVDLNLSFWQPGE